MAGAEGVTGAQELQVMLAAFLSAVEASLEDGTLQAADASPTSNAALHEQRVLLAQLQSERDLLHSRLQCFEQVKPILPSSSAFVKGDMVYERCLPPHEIVLLG